MIQSFSCKQTERLWNREKPKKFPPSIHRVALRKLEILHAAVELSDLRTPPGNRLEALKGDRKGQHSIRINNQWRICFVWRGGHSDKVTMLDYH